MATKSYSKHKEYKEYSSSRGTVPYTDEQFGMYFVVLFSLNWQFNFIFIIFILSHERGNKKYPFAKQLELVCQIKKN